MKPMNLQGGSPEKIYRGDINIKNNTKMAEWTVKVLKDLENQIEKHYQKESNDAN